MSLSVGPVRVITSAGLQVQPPLVGDEARGLI